MKRIILILTALLLVLSMFSCKKQPKPVSEVPEVPEAPVEVSDVIIKDEIISEKTDFEVGVSAEMNITAPKVEAPDYGDNVNGYNQLIDMLIDTVRVEYDRDVSIGQGAEGAAETSRMLTYDVFTAKDGYVSVMIKINVAIAGTVNPTVVYRCISYDLKEGKLLSLADAIGEDKVAVVKSLIIEQMKEHPEKFYSVADNVLDDVDISYSFLENEDKIVIVIDEYTIAPRSQGAQIFEINKTDIG